MASQRHGVVLALLINHLVYGPPLVDAFLKKANIILTHRLQDSVSERLELRKVPVGMPTHVLEFVEVVVPQKHQPIVVGDHEGPRSHPELYGKHKFYAVPRHSILGNLKVCS